MAASFVASERPRLLAWIDAYREAQNAALSAIDPAAVADVVALLQMAGDEGRRIFVCGNGGNDFSFDDVFVRQLASHAESGDVLIMSSVSGSSPNLVAAIRWAKQHDLVTVALVGSRQGTIGPLADHLIVVPDTHCGRVEDVQVNVLHMLCCAFMERG